MTRYEHRYLLRPGSSFGLFSDAEKVLRLAPQWDVKEFRGQADAFEVTLEYDRDERASSFAGSIDDDGTGRLHLSLSSPEADLDLRIRVEEGGVAAFEVETRPNPGQAELLEYDLWARSIVNYLGISGSRSPLTRAWKWFLDRWWLGMTQSGKRMAFFILAGEAMSLVFLVALLLWWKYFSGP